MGDRILRIDNRSLGSGFATLHKTRLARLSNIEHNGIPLLPRYAISLIKKSHDDTISKNDGLLAAGLMLSRPYCRYVRPGQEDKQKDKNDGIAWPPAP
jgi:hypothetical protein